MKTAIVQRAKGSQTRAQRSILKAQAALLRRQHPDGYWVGNLEADVSVGAGYIPLLFLLTGRVPEQRAERIAAHLLARQNPDGSWSSYFGGPGDLSVSAQAYFALKLAGQKPDQPGLRAARAFIRRAGGFEGVNTITRIWLALFGQASWEAVPTLPPELILLPAWVPLNIYDFASWSRATIVAFMAIFALRPVWPVPASASLQDIALRGGNGKGPGSGAGAAIAGSRAARAGSRAAIAGSRPRHRRGWEAAFLLLDRLLKAWEKSGFKPLRRQALRKVENWILAHQEEDGSWGGILLPWVYSLIALRALGRTPEDPVIRKGLRGLEDFFVEEKGGLWLQPATSPVWDTAWSVIALRESGLPPDHPALRAAAAWLLKQEIRRKGDWAVKNPRTMPGCWAFEFANRFYPDLDDTALVPRALLRVQLDGTEEVKKQEAIRRAAAWIEAMQGKDGGWAAFDRDNNRRILAHVPYGDFMTPLDPASPDVTAHVLELLRELGGGSRSVSAGVRYLHQKQEPDGAWYGRWGVNYLYGTGLSLAALAVCGERPEEARVRKAVAWLESCQNPDGGWGESCRSYDDPRLRGQGPSTASQTAWALLGLRGAGAAEAGKNTGRESVARCLQRGLDYLLDAQRANGEWQEAEYTGTGFPRAFYLRYDLYRLYFPLLALGKCLVGQKELSELERRMSRIPPGERVLLVSHCLRKSSGCHAVQGKWGLECRHCTEGCAVHRLSQAALRLGYKGVCIAPGGSMALSYVRRTQPRGIVAVACRKELEQGIQAVSGAASSFSPPAILAVPLTKDGCVDTEVDVPRALQTIELGGTANG